MTTKADGGPAFPLAVAVSSAGDVYSSGDIAAGEGMTLRDWFAGQVLLRAHDSGGRYALEGMKRVAEYSYAIADAMLAARSK